MPDLIDSAQLQATAQVAKSYILEQDTANVNTIINALQQGGGSTTTKLEPTFTVGNGTYEYNGDGEIFGFVTGNYCININRANKRFSVVDSSGFGTIGSYTVTLHATEGDNYAAKTVTLSGGDGGGVAG